MIICILLSTFSFYESNAQLDASFLLKYMSKCFEYCPKCNSTRFSLFECSFLGVVSCSNFGNLLGLEFEEGTRRNIPKFEEIFIIPIDWGHMVLNGMLYKGQEIAEHRTRQPWIACLSWTGSYRRMYHIDAEVGACRVTRNSDSMMHFLP